MIESVTKENKTDIAQSRALSEEKYRGPSNKIEDSPYKAKRVPETTTSNWPVPIPPHELFIVQNMTESEETSDASPS